MSELSGPVLTFFGVLVVAASGLAGTVAASLISKRASDRAQNTEDKKVDLSVLQASVTDLTGRLGRVEEELAHERSQRKLSNAYARTLASVLRDHQMEVPPPPPELDLP